MSRLDNKTALVTGGASGIGRAIALRFAEEGAAVAVADLKESPRRGGTPTHELIRDKGGRSFFTEIDVSSVESIRNAVKKTVEEFGALDVMVNNAGIFMGTRPIEKISEEDFQKVMEINVKGAFFGAKIAAEVMKKQNDGGSIINMSSIAGLFGFKEASDYSVSKGAVANLSRVLALELGPAGIRINSINPGVIQTSMTEEDEPISGTMTGQIPLRRDGRPEEIANVALFLASDESSYVTGHNLVADGGYTAK